MDVEEVKSIVRDSLGMDKDKVITETVPIMTLGAELVDLLDICFRTKTYDMKNFSDGRLNERGRNFLRDVGKYCEREHGNGLRFFRFARGSIEEFFKSLTPYDIVLMSEYKERLKGVETT